MPGTLLKPVDLSSLARRGLDMEERLSLTELPRLVEALPPSNSRPVTVQLRAGVDNAGRVVVSGRLGTHWMLVCQRCLGEFEQQVDDNFRWTFEREPDAAFVLTDEPVRLSDHVEDELLLALPQIPTHADPAQCDRAVQRYLDREEGASAGETRTPFANLKTLMRGGD